MLAYLRHLELDGAPVLEPPGRARREVTSAERRAELERPHGERAGVRVGLTRDRALGGLDESTRGLLRKLLGWGALELRQELDGLVEVVGADLDQLFARAL